MTSPTPPGAPHCALFVGTLQQEGLSENTSVPLLLQKCGGAIVCV